ncbi:hypothetical protein [Arcicella aurantiaca]|uniref:hypothetical protein n=1 Tax=Arcicella aurantiaca TaxID=591202 RepID=UPI0013049CB4|nr:hypothetical protein [Arcicella aurantiaca]
MRKAILEPDARPILNASFLRNSKNGHFHFRWVKTHRYKIGQAYGFFIRLPAKVFYD